MAAVEEDLQLIFSHYNKTLFDSALPSCQINLCRKAKKPGFFSSERWLDGQKTIIHEINLNPQILEMGAIKWHGILVFNMAKLWQLLKGTAAKEEEYVNKILVQKMLELGFYIKKSGGLGGKNSGRNISFEENPVGLYCKNFSGCPIKAIDLQPLPEPEKDNEKEEKSTKYQCPSCGSHLRGKQWLIDLCCECWELRIPQGIPEEEWSPEYYKKVQILKKILFLIKGLKNRLYLKATAEYDENIQEVQRKNIP